LYDRYLFHPLIKSLQIFRLTISFSLPALKTALKHLGYHAYHARELEKMPSPKKVLAMILEGLRAKYNGDGEPFGRREFDVLFGDYDCIMDTPQSQFVDELTTAYPEAKVILTTRDFDSWLVSMNASIAAEFYESNFLRRLARFDGEYAGPIMEFADECRRLIGFDTADRKKSREMFDKHYEHVKAVVPKENLLEYRVGTDGWGPLCAFLGKDIPERPFPRANDSRRFRRNAFILKVILAGRVLGRLLILPALGVVLVAFLLTLWKGR
jgi:hypothetical protein